MSGRHPALARLDVLVGRWTVRPKVEGVGTASIEFAWQDGGLFLLQRSSFDGRWEMSKDGQTWNLDFELAHLRER
jgi:hypothetical protein